MSVVWDDGPPKVNHRMVLLALADFANDEGWCWPSISTLCRKTTLSERAVQGCIRDLENEGWLFTVKGGGTKSNQYRITPAQRAPVQDMPPRTSCPAPPHSVPHTPAQRAPKPSVTTNEPSVRSNEADEIRLALETWASPSAVSSFIAYRRKAKGKGNAFTLTAAKRLASNLKAIFDRGGDCDDALGMAEERVWLTVQEDWYFNAKGKSNGNGTHSGGGRSGPHHALMAGFAMAADKLKN